MSRLGRLIRRGFAGAAPNPGGGTGPDPSTFVRLSSLGYGDDDPVDVDPGTVLMMDYGPGEGPLLGDIINAGTIIYDPAKAVEVRARSFTNLVTGFHDITQDGTPRPLTRPITWTFGKPGDMPSGLTRGLNFTGNTRRYNSDTQDDGGRIRGYRNMGGRERMIAETPADLHVPAGADIAANATSITLSKGVYWRQGDVVAIPPTFYIKSDKPTEYRVLNADTNGSATITFDTPLTYARAGKLQYIVDAGSGLSFTPGAFTYDANAAVTTASGLSNTATLRAHVDQESEQDLRCYVALISTSSCKMTCVDDANWQNDGYGFHIMQMGDATLSNLQWAGIWFDRFGQRGRHARYGFHFHNMSWRLFNSDGTLMTTPVYRGLINPQSYFRRLGFYRGENRVMTVHNTDGTLIEECSMFGGVGTGLFHEDGTEKRNVFNRNIIGDIREPATGMELKGFDTARTNTQFFGPQGMWTANLDNDFTANRIYGINGTGWSIPVTNGIDGRTGYGFGDAHNVPLDLTYQTAGVQERNVAQSCQRARQMTIGVTNEQGNTTIGYRVGSKNSSGQLVPTVFGRFSMFYNLIPYQNQALDPTYQNWVCIAWKEIVETDGGRRDGSWLAFSGSTSGPYTDGIQNAICIGHDLYDDDTWRGPQIPFASYHNTINFPNALIMNIGQSAIGVRNGLIYWGSSVATEDLYLNGIHKGFVASPGWRVRNVRMMDRSAPQYPEFITSSRYDALPPAMKTAINNRTAPYNRTFAAPIPDPDGLFGFGKGAVNLLNHPHWTTGLTVTADPLNDTQVYTNTPFVGVNLNTLDVGIDTYNTFSQKWSRIDTSTNAVISGTVIDYGLPNAPPNIGRFVIDSVPAGGWLKFETPSNAKPTTSIRGVLDLFQPGLQPILVTLPWNGAAPACHQANIVNRGGGAGEVYATSVGSLAAVKSASTTSLWFDSTNKEVTIKFCTIAPTVSRLSYAQEVTYQQFEVYPA